MAEGIEAALCENALKNLSLDPDVADVAPHDTTLPPSDYEHLVTYLRLLNADAEGPTGRSREDRAAHRPQHRTAASTERTR